MNGLIKGHRQMVAVVLAAAVWLCLTHPISAAAPVRLSAEETDLLVRSVAAVTEGAPYAARVGIAATVLNRLHDPRFPNSIPWIIISDAAFPLAASHHVSEAELTLTRAALDAAMTGLDPTHGALCFSTPSQRAIPFNETCAIDGYRFGVPLS